MYIYIYIYIYTSLSLSIYIYIYIYIYVYNFCLGFVFGHRLSLSTSYDRRSACVCLLAVFSLNKKLS